MKIKRSHLKMLIRECILEILEAVPSPGNITEVEIMLDGTVYTFSVGNVLDIDHLELLDINPPLPKGQYEEPYRDIVRSFLLYKGNGIGTETDQMFNRRSYGYLRSELGIAEEEQLEPYDPETDTFAPGPRQRPETWKKGGKSDDQKELNKWKMGLDNDKAMKQAGSKFVEEGSFSQSYETLGQALNAVEEYIVQNGIQVDPTEHFQDPTDPGLKETDPYRIREPFLYGGIAYGQTKNADYKLAAYKGKPTRKYLHVNIIRLDSGKYEVNAYVL